MASMTMLPSALKGNIPANSQPVQHRAPKFEKHLKSSRNVQLKPLKVERRFSHYEQKIANAPIERCNVKMPRRLQTRKLSRPVKPMYDDERIKWNERLAAWLREDQSSSVEYIKFTDQFNIIEKQLYYCSACHEFFHLNLKEREKRRGCPRHRNRHEDYVRPVSVKKVKKPRRSKPTVVPKDPFGDRSNLKIPSLLPPKPSHRKVNVDVPPLPPITKTRPNISLQPPAPSQASVRRIYPSPASTTSAFTPIVVNDDPLPSPTKFESIVETPPSSIITKPHTEHRSPPPREPESPELQKNTTAHEDVEVTLPLSSPAPAQDSDGNRPKPPPPDLPDLDFDESPDLPPVKKRKPPLTRRNAMVLPPIEKENKPPSPETPRPVKPKEHRMTSEELARRMRKAKEINGYRNKNSSNASEDQQGYLESANFDIYENSFLEKYCLISAKQLETCRRVFNQFDQDNDGLLKTEEVINAIHKMFSPKVIEDAEMCYIFRILETTSFDMFSDRMNLKLFAIVMSLAQRISELDEYMKHLIGRVNTEVVDWKIHEARSLFEYTMRKDHTGTYKVPMEALWLELHAGGISKEHELQARKSLAHMKELDLLDFLTYLPLFLLVHSNVVDNPLNLDRYV